MGGHSQLIGWSPQFFSMATKGVPWPAVPAFLASFPGTPSLPICNIHSGLQSDAFSLWVFKHTWCLCDSQCVNTSSLLSRMTSLLLYSGLTPSSRSDSIIKFPKLFWTSLTTLHLHQAEMTPLSFMPWRTVYGPCRKRGVIEKHKIWVSDFWHLSVWHLLVLCPWKTHLAHTFWVYF